MSEGWCLYDTKRKRRASPVCWLDLEDGPAAQWFARIYLDYPPSWLRRADPVRYRKEMAKYKKARARYLIRRAAITVTMSDVTRGLPK